MKRKAPEEDSGSDSDNESEDSGPQEIVDVDFDFFNPEQLDFHALKRLLNQLFSADAELINIGDIVDIILEENHVGTTVKVDGQQSDPYAILSVINLNYNKNNEGVKSLHKYIMSKCPQKEEKTLREILSLDSDKHVGWVVSERFINMPMEVMPPMYSMMQEEVAAAAKKKEPYTFEWYMFIVKTYRETESTVDKEDEEQEEPPKKKGKKKAKAPAVSSEVFYFQPEDEVVDKYASHRFEFKFTNRDKEASADARRTFSEFGIAPSRRLLLVHQSKFSQMVEEIEKTCSVQSSN